MAKIEISGASFHPRDLIIKLDGVEVSNLISLKLELHHDDVNECSITFLVDEIDVEAETLTALTAKLEQKGEPEPGGSKIL